MNTSRAARRHNHQHKTPENAIISSAEGCVTSRRVDIALLGLFGVENYGNEASLAAVIGYLRGQHTNRQLVVICPCPASVTRDHEVAAIPMWNWDRPRSKGILKRVASKLFLRIPREIASWAKTIRYMRNVRCMVIPGTGFLDDFSVSPFGVPYDIFRWCVCARLSGAQISFVSIGAGPIENCTSRWFMKTAARVARYRSYRDELSLKFMSDIGLDTRNDKVYPDLAFNMQIPGTTRPSPSTPAQCTVGVGVMKYFGWHGDALQGGEIFRTYLGKITKFILWLLAQQHVVRLIIGDGCDVPAVEYVTAAVKAESKASGNGRFFARQIKTLYDVLDELAGTDVVVATRFHNVVFALMLDKPVISLGYAAKNEALLQGTGLGKYCQHIERFDLDRLILDFIEVRDDRESIAGRIHSQNNEYRQRLMLQYEELFSAQSPAT